jgi:hypothetical protein
MANELTNAQAIYADVPWRKRVKAAMMFRARQVLAGEVPDVDQHMIRAARDMLQNPEGDVYTVRFAQVISHDVSVAGAYTGATIGTMPDSAIVNAVNQAWPWVTTVVMASEPQVIPPPIP